MKKVIPLKPLLVLDYTTFLNVNKYYSNPNLHLFLLTGGRGIGKTTGFVCHAINDFITKGEEFVYIRRYKTELKKAKNMPQGYYSGIDTKGIGQGAIQWEHKGVRMGYGLCLSMQASFKSGMDFSKVTTIIFDEALLLAGGMYRYLDNEVVELLELISTIVRTRTNYRIFLLGNNLVTFNPYYEFFKVPAFKDVYIDKDRGLYCEVIANSAKLLAKESETPLYKLTKATAYGEYHYDNKLLVQDTGVVGDKEQKAYLFCRLVCNSVTLNLYRQNDDEIYVELRDKVIKDVFTYIILEENIPNYLYIKKYRQSDDKKLIDMAYYNGNMVYASQQALAVFLTFMEAI